MNIDVARFQQKLLEWYGAHRRELPWRGAAEPYAVWTSEVMLQQTQVATVIPYYERWMAQFPGIAQLAQADIQTVLKQWEGLGYYARARNFHRAAKMVCEQHGGRVPDDYAAFRRLPGVGDYIAAAVQSIAFGAPYAVVDGNVKRVLSRVLLCEWPVNDAPSTRHYQRMATQLLAEKRPGDFNQAMMELGATVCRPTSPDCRRCPLRRQCAAHQQSRQEEFPLRKARQKVPHQHQVICVVMKGNQLLIRQRPENGLLGGLWECPNGEPLAGESAQEACRRLAGEHIAGTTGQLHHLTEVKHAYTHFRVTADVFVLIAGDDRRRASQDATAVWIDLKQLRDYPLPKTHHKFLGALSDWLFRRDSDGGEAQAGELSP